MARGIKRVGLTGATTMTGTGSQKYALLSPGLPPACFSSKRRFVPFGRYRVGGVSCGRRAVWWFRWKWRERGQRPRCAYEIEMRSFRFLRYASTGWCFLM